MPTLVYHIIFLIISIYILLKAIGYGLYEINTIKNKTGGIAVITFSVFVIIFSNIVVWLN